jgi:hypothetical protein
MRCLEWAWIIVPDNEQQTTEDAKCNCQDITAPFARKLQKDENFSGDY